jgi:phosphate transport system protein
MRTAFAERLSQLEADLQEEGELVRRALRGARAALATGDGETAAEVIAFDREIDRRFMRLERAFEELLARENPVATDLRLVLALLHANLHLERMADHCVTIAKLVRANAGLPSDGALLEVLGEMAVETDRMIGVALDALAGRSIGAAETLIVLDATVDRANRRMVGRVLELPRSAEWFEWGLRIVLVSRCLERICDHAVDIGEQVAYLVSGSFREFTDASRPEERV